MATKADLIEVKTELKGAVLLNSAMFGLAKLLRH